MSDKILMQNMMFYGFHGVFEYERDHGQRFYIDIDMKVNMQQAGQSDELADAVDYTQVYSEVKDIVENRRFKLLEALASTIAECILIKFSSVNEITVRIRKPGVPIPGQFDFVQIEVTRRQLS